MADIAEDVQQLETDFTTLEASFTSLEADYMYLGVASSYGVDDSIGTADATALLNNYFAALKAKGLKYAYFDRPHTYRVSGQLTEAKDIILIGNATIKSTHLDNYFVQVCNDQSQFTGKYNTKVYNASMFSTFAAALASNNIKVCVWGDSISTGGNDCLGISYAGIPSSFTASSPNGITAGESYYQRLIDMMTTTFQASTFNFYNRGIASTKISQWQSNQTFGSTTKSWIDHIKDTDADLLIIAFGMNDSTIAGGKEFSYYMDQITTYINANFTKKPSIVWLTTPRAFDAIGTVWGGYDRQFGQELAAYAARKFGQSKGHYIIDVNRVSNIKRSGFDFGNPIMESIAVTDTEISEIISGTFSKVGNEYSLKELGTNLIFDVALKDFVLEFDWKSTTATGDYLWIDINQIGSNSCVVLFWPRSTNGKVMIYPRYLDNTHWSQHVDYNAPVVWDDSTYRTIRIEKRVDIINVYVNSILVDRARYDINNLPGKINLKKNGLSDATFTFRNFKLYGASYKQYLPSLTDSDMFGAYDGASSTKSPNGGNGLNHPSSVGLQEVYVPALQEFVNDLSE